MFCSILKLTFSLSLLYLPIILSGWQKLETVIDIISRDIRVKVTADTLGNLGPPSVMIQKFPGSNWIKDRWQAASDMGGTGTSLSLPASSPHYFSVASI